MAAPDSITTLDLSGVWIMNKSLSDSTDDMLMRQGVGWIKRKAILAATVTLSVSHYKDNDGVEHIDINQTLTGGIPGTTELRTLDWTSRSREDHIFGAILGKSRRTKVGDIGDAFLKKDWLPDTLEHNAIEAYAESDTPKSNRTWAVTQVWGFETVQDQRRHSRHLKFSSPEKEDLELRLVYDYVGPV